MWFNWLTRRRRAHMLETPFPEEWEAIVRRNVSHWPLVDDERRAGVRGLMAKFYTHVSRYTTSGFLRMKLGAALSARGVSPHIYESPAAEAAETA